jgi:hypothetical protein
MKLNFIVDITPDEILQIVEKYRQYNKEDIPEPPSVLHPHPTRSWKGCQVMLRTRESHTVMTPDDILTVICDIEDGDAPAVELKKTGHGIFTIAKSKLMVV